MGDRRDRMAAGSGKLVKADDSVLDLAALLEAVYDVANRAIRTAGGGGETTGEVDANLQVGDAAVADENPVPVSDAGASLSVDGEVDANLHVAGAAVTALNPVPIDGTTNATVVNTVWTQPTAGGFAPMSALASLAGYNEIIAAPGEGDEIIVAGFTIQATEDGAQIATLCSEEDDTVGFVARLATAGDGLKWVFPAGNEWRLGEDTALDLNLSGYTEVQVTVYYKTAGVVPWV